MFSKVIKEGTIPPNFLNSILTNPSLYEMFKNDYEENRDYFQNLEKDDYLSAMLGFIENSLFSSNIYNIYSDDIGEDELEERTRGKLAYIKNFYDDFLLDEFREDPDSILKTKFFRGMAYAQENDIFASKTQEFKSLYNYVFKESIDYDDVVEILIKEAVKKLSSDEVLSMKEFDNLCNFVKNNTEGYVSMTIVTKMLKNHAYKSNHIFDREVVESLVRSLAKSYLWQWDIEVDVEFLTEAEREELDYQGNQNRIIIDEELIEEFLKLNYTEIFTVLFFEAERLKSRLLLERDKVDYATLKVIMNMVTAGVDFDRIYMDETYEPIDYHLDLKVSCFVKTLRFFSTFGVNLFQNYNEAELSKLDINLDETEKLDYSFKETSLDQRFFRILTSYDRKNSIIKKFNVLKMLFNSKGERLRALELIKKMFDSEHKGFLVEYLHSRVVDPEMMIDDVLSLCEYKPKNEEMRQFIEDELKYIYVDTFYYSLDSYLKLMANPKFDKEDYLMDLAFKINCIKDTPLTHRFIDEAIFTIEEMKQNA